MKYSGSLCIVLVLLVSMLTSSYAQISEDEEKEILRAHNLYRGQVDPISTNMEEMVRKICI